MPNLSVYVNKIILAVSIVVILFFTLGGMYAPKSDANKDPLNVDTLYLTDIEIIPEFEEAEISENYIMEHDEEESIKIELRKKSFSEEGKDQPELQVKVDKYKSYQSINEDENNSEVYFDDFDDEIEYYYAEEDIPFLELESSAL